jgi:DNA excision repair protein ERCC-2
VIQLACLDASSAIAPCFQALWQRCHQHQVLFLRIDLYRNATSIWALCFRKRWICPLFRPCIRPLVITRGSDQLAVSTKYEDRGDIGVVRNYGAMLVELCSVIPRWEWVCLSHHTATWNLLSSWSNAMGVLRGLTKSKLVFIEKQKDMVETTLALDNYRRACNCGRGACLSLRCKRKSITGYQFWSALRTSSYHHVWRPLSIYSKSRFSRELDWNICKRTIRSESKTFLNFDALRQASQCVGRVIRKQDWLWINAFYSLTAATIVTTKGLSSPSGFFNFWRNRI